MPVFRLNSYRVRCDGCNKDGGEWHGKEARIEAKPQGWLFAEWDRSSIEGHVIYCPDCTKQRGYPTEEHEIEAQHE